ncbi:amidohydrolase family protein [Amycolatopsis sp. NBC_01488]|uniref:amidohydrolase family protein n=1 Tax=Amycolatopsis sp. NBC_01488 TaxID=2903563 RepID=UPI002E2BCACE|nr:amidohydrolase family protein [Amycolatopsis sp. NBC_01488]
MLDWFHCADHPENADAAIAALREAPGHSIFCYGAAGPDIEPEIRRVRDVLPGEDLALGLRGPVMSTMDETAADVALAKELGLRMSTHVHGTGGWPHGDRPIAGMAERGLLDDRVTVVHGNGLSDDQLAMLADAGSSVSISPDVELKMGFEPLITGRALAAGIRPSLSVDDCPSAGGDLFSAMRTALAAERGGLASRDVLAFATIDGARTCGREARTGSITVDKDADLVLLDAEDPSVFPVGNAVGTVVAAGHPGLVDSVFVAGKAVKHNGKLLDVDLPALRARLLASRDRIAAAAGIAVDGSWTP